MSCNKPMHMLHYDFKRFIEQADLSIPKKAELIMRYRRQGWKINYDDLQGYRLMSTDSSNIDVEKCLDEFNLDKSYFELIEVPCGKCIGCRLDYAKDWANRCNLESQNSKDNYFITLTYDDEHMPRGKLGNGTLVKDDFATFIHALRDYFRLNYNFLAIKYFGCGEYGDLTFRPHYHMILFNCPLFDLTVNFPSADHPGAFVQKKDQRGGSMFYSPLLAKCWNKGIITVQPATWNMECYVSKYVLKKLDGNDKDAYDSLGVLPPFLRCSQNLGKQYLLDNLDHIKDDPTIIVGRQGKSPLVSGLPRYYKKYLKKQDPEYYKTLIDKARVRSNDKNSCIRSFQKLNDNRKAKESQLNANNQFSRDF